MPPSSATLLPRRSPYQRPLATLNLNSNLSQGTRKSTQGTATRSQCASAARRKPPSSERIAAPRERVAEAPVRYTPSSCSPRSPSTTIPISVPPPAKPPHPVCIFSVRILSSLSSRCAALLSHSSPDSPHLPHLDPSPVVTPSHLSDGSRQADCQACASAPQSLPPRPLPRLAPLFMCYLNPGPCAPSARCAAGSRPPRTGGVLVLLSGAPQ